MQSCDGYKRVVTNSTKSLLPKQILYARNKCLYLHTAYIIALDKLGRGTNTWVNTCCQEAVDVLARLGFDTTSDRKRISYWNIDFFKENWFPHSNPYIANRI
jgi:hypothetical protein